MEVTVQALRDLLVEAGLDRAAAEAARPDALLPGQAWAALDHPALIRAIEDRFGVAISERDAPALRTLDDLAAYIRSRRKVDGPEDGHIARLLRDWRQVEPGRPYEIGPLRPGDGRGVAQLFHTIYGDRYPVEDYYVPERIERLNAEGAMLTVVARLEGGIVAGQGAYYQSSPPNRALFEFGQVMVAPEYRDTLMAAKIIREMDRLSRAMSQAQGFFGEAVCTHTVTQKLVYKQGYSECGLELSLMPAGAYEKEGAGARRVSCLLGARVDRDRRMPLHLPQCYRGELEFILNGLRLERDILFSPPDEPAAAETSLERRTFDFARVERAQALAVGADFPALAARLDREAADKGLAVLQVFVNAGAPGAAFAVEALRARGFFLGGLVPLWFGPDGLLMQKLYVKPEFEAITLHSDKAKAIFEHVRADFGRARSLA
jgi:acyl carrier protein